MGVGDSRWLAAAFDQAKHESKDPSTQNGAVLVENEQIVGKGANRFATGVAETPERWERPAKYAHVVHAEVAATISGLRAGADPARSTLYVVWYACTDCAKVIIEAGVKRVVGHHNLREFAEAHSPGWTDSITTALVMLEEAGVECVWHHGPVDAAPILVGGALFDPRAV